MKKIIYRKDSGEVSFFRRDIVAEKKAIQLLESSGLQRIGDIHFRLSASSSEKTLVEWINKHREMLQSDFQLTGHMGNTPYCLDEIHIEQSCDDEVVDWFELHITVVVGNLRIPFSRLRGAYKCMLQSYSLLCLNSHFQQVRILTEPFLG